MKATINGADYRTQQGRVEMHDGARWICVASGVGGCATLAALATDAADGASPLPTLDATPARGDCLTIAERVEADLSTLIGMASAGHRDGEAAAWSMIHNQVAEMVRRMRVGTKR